MSARPLIAGRLYRVSIGHGQRLDIIADHPCTALIIALERNLPCAA